MRWLLRITAWRSKQPALARWSEVLGLYAIVFIARIKLGAGYGLNPGLTFYPLILIASFLFGWLEAAVVLLLSIAAGIYFFLPPGMFLMPLGWLFVGSLTIAIVTALRKLAEELDAANQRQATLFRELQHRVANTLQSVVGTLELAQMQIDTAPHEVKVLLDNAARRFSTSAEVHRRLHDPEIFHQGLNCVLRDAVATVIDLDRVKVDIDVAPIALTFDQSSIVAMLVIESANNAQKHVFAHNLGHSFSVSLRAIGERIVLAVKDDGPGWASRTNDSGSLGLTIIHGLLKQIDGQLSVASGNGTEISITFPLPRNK